MSVTEYIIKISLKKYLIKPIVKYGPNVSNILTNFGKASKEETSVIFSKPF